MPISTVFFDLDATLYPADNGLWPAIGERIEAYLRQVMNIPTGEIRALKQHYYDTYGTTLRGLQLNHDIDPHAYLDFVHDLPIRSYLSPDPALQRMLEQLSLPRWVFTNSDRNHSQRVLQALGIERCFDGIIAIEEMIFDCKPNPTAFRAALKLAGEADPSRVTFLDDSPRNLVAARNMGFYTILVGEDTGQHGAHQALTRPHDLPLALPELFKK